LFLVNWPFIETARAVWSLVGQEYVEDFALVRGAALLFYGADIRTSDADFAITAQSLPAFEEAARQDERSPALWDVIGSTNPLPTSQCTSSPLTRAETKALSTSVAKKAFDNRTRGVRRGGVCIGASENRN